MFEPIGVSGDEERFYLAVLRDPGASLGSICRVSGLSIQRGTVVAAALEEKGLVSRSPAGRRGLVAAPPETALEPLLLRSHAELASVSTAIAQLAEEHHVRDGGRRAHELIEVIEGSAAVLRRFEQLQRGARHEIRMFVRPPRAQPSRGNRTELRLLRHGVRYRALYDREALLAPGSIDEISVFQAEGEQARSLESLPLKLAISDRTSALVPLSTGETPVEPGAVLVHRSALLDALIALFDALWEDAVPLTPDHGRPAGPLSEEDARTLGLLMSGLTDDAVARQLGVSVRTVQRRVRRFMTVAQVSTRLQLGRYAQQHGWV